MSKTLEYKSILPKIFSLRCWAKNVDSEYLKSRFNQLLSDTGFTVLNFSEHHFPVQGYTSIWLLAESHLAIHTFPQNGWSYVELSGCNEEKTLQFKKLLKETNLEISFEEDKMAVSHPENNNTKSIK
ncbi:S-adenosylmethionine decarboxylase [Marivirga tractuosa]|uniref:S-adenosylmethionine decarboxylase family protein n=1 Tax=Marivirga tractuosa TaxID=1006 RepID=UPI0035D12F71